MKIPPIRLIVAIVLIFAVVEGLSLYKSLTDWKPQTPAPAPSATSWLQLTLPDLDQKPQPLSQWRGRVVVLNFWASWCEPCKDEMPLLERLQQSWPSDQVRFVGIGIDDRSALMAYLKTQPMSYPILVGTGQTLSLTSPYGNRQEGLPFTLVLDRQGQVVSQKLGRVREEELRAAIATASRSPQS